MSTEAPTEFMRYGTMREWLKQNGFPECEIMRMIAKGLIQARPIRPGGRAWYNASQIKRDVLNGWEEPNQQQASQ
jgi:hypothetical protein